MRGVAAMNRTTVERGELWEQVIATHECVTRSGMEVEVIHVRGHAREASRLDNLGRIWRWRMRSLVNGI